MKCLLCESYSFKHICNSCQQTYLKPSLYKFKLTKNIEVISFYKYDDIKQLLHTKHTNIGYYIFNILANNSFKKFAKAFQPNYILTSVAVDDNPKDLYSHTAILNHALKSKYIKPQHNTLKAKNKVNYSGKDRNFRLKNPRNFEINLSINQQIILVDDIMTTGTTLLEAIHILEKKGFEVAFCLVLVNVTHKS